MEAFLTKYGSWFFITFMVLGVIPILQYDTILNEPFFFAFDYLTIPVLIVSYFLYFTTFPKYRKQAGDIKGCLWVFMLCCLFILMSQGYVMYVNATFGTQLDTKLEGKIVELDTYTSNKGGTSYYVYIDNTATGEILKLDVSKRHFDKLKVGNNYSEIWKTGSLDILYR
ncbi:hypothetical protein [Pseudoalteromonas piratica]|uniref:Uncharacterized protein n=1 Tax=Pseudoalteromonas piratica TaxID=1348114 RepID=A0A0A7EKK6_9GAMM|nr:hypothetical protein [Pseudoalteromonas piratica]AIY67078.1 hypothetical protein OM33_18565 [Pseudoalteromonas piratica]